jgi:formylmethanofuran dehydrogenase subunit E
VHVAPTSAHTLEEMAMRLPIALLAVAILAAALPTQLRAETPDEWVQLGARVHGGFGAFIPVGIRIGLDALERLNAKPREVTVTYYDSDKAPCACVADGLAIATVATVGQRTMQIAPEKAPSGVMAVIVVRSKQSGAVVKYTVSDAWLPKLIEFNKTFEPRDRYDAVMKADGLFEAVTEK